MTHRSKLGLAVLIVVLLMAPTIIRRRAQIRSLIAQLPAVRHALGKKTVEDQIATYGQGARTRLTKTFRERGVNYPPDKITFVVLKDRPTLEVYAASPGQPFKFVRKYSIFAASGVLGPKLRDGDFQVPEGLYHIESPEPNTPYHLGLRVNYPNEFDLLRAKEDNRTNLGGDILIHGSNLSIGCLAMGDEASEDLFVLVYDTRDKNVPLIIAPLDLRASQPPTHKESDPKWLPGLYRDIGKALNDLPLSK